MIDVQHIAGASRQDSLQFLLPFDNGLVLGNGIRHAAANVCIQYERTSAAWLVVRSGKAWRNFMRISKMFVTPLFRNWLRNIRHARSRSSLIKLGLLLFAMVVSA